MSIHINAEGKYFFKDGERERGEREKRERERVGERGRQTDRDRERGTSRSVVFRMKEKVGEGAGISYPVSKGLRTIIPLYI